MGANIMPMVKNRGRTVLGVRIGLLRSRGVSKDAQGWQSRSVICKEEHQHTARPSIAVAERRYLIGRCDVSFSIAAIRKNTGRLVSSKACWEPGRKSMGRKRR